MTLATSVLATAGTIATEPAPWLTLAFGVGFVAFGLLGLRSIEAFRESKAAWCRRKILAAHARRRRIRRAGLAEVLSDHSYRRARRLAALRK